MNTVEHSESWMFHGHDLLVVTIDSRKTISPGHCLCVRHDSSEEAMLKRPNVATEPELAGAEFFNKFRT